jgi:hypothetical protein
MDTSDPLSPHMVAGIRGSTTCFGRSIAAAGGYLYMGSVGTEGELRAADISDPTATHVTFPNSSGWCSGQIGGLLVSGDHLYVGLETDLMVADLSDPSSPAPVGSCKPTPVSGNPESLAIDASGRYVYVASGWYGLGIVEVSSPAHPVPVAVVTGLGWVHRVAVSGGYLYLADDDVTYGRADVLRIYSLADPAAPVEVATWSTDGLVISDLKIVGSYLYIADGHFGFRVVGITNPVHLVEVKQCALPNLGWGMAVAFPLGPSGIAEGGGYIYVADYGHGLYTFRLSDTFPDVDIDSWATDAIERCVDAAVVRGFGDGTYQPQGAVTRAQMAIYIARTLAGGDELVPTGPATATFSDVDASNPAYRYIEYVVAEGVVTGYPSDNTYRPTEALNRGQMAAFIARALCGGESSVPVGPATASFPDVPASFTFFRHVEYILGAGVTSGYQDGLYHPERQCLRDQMAVFVTRAFDFGS